MNNRNLSIALRPLSILFLTILISASARAQSTVITTNNNQSEHTSALSFAASRRHSLTPAGFLLLPATRSRMIPRSNYSVISLTPLAAGLNLQVLGGGTIGRLTKWTGITSSNSFIGDSSIFESKFGLVGIGTDVPTSKLTVAGMIETTLGGFKFPDGTVQTTAAVSGLPSVFHDTTLQGNGTTASPLGVAVPLILSGAVDSAAVMSAINTATGDARGDAVFAQGSSGNFAGGGLTAVGGNSQSRRGGTGVTAIGGNSDSIFGGGTGMLGTGGINTNGPGGAGVLAFGGDSTSASGGVGLSATGGNGPLGNGPAGFFSGNVEITGTLSKGGGSFKIDHPLDPENKYLYHSFVESPDMMNIYNGNVKLDSNGEALVRLPAWFEALNKDYRYTLTAIGAPCPNLYIAEEVDNNHFRIAGGTPGAKVSWAVTGVRNDPWANKHRIPVEEDKPTAERGHYLYPELYDQPLEKSIQWVLYPGFVKQLKERR